MDRHREATLQVLNSWRGDVGDPRQRRYAVRVTDLSPRAAEGLASHLRELGLSPRVGDGAVTLSRWDDLSRLFDLVGDGLLPERRNALETLVLARGPVPDSQIDWMINTLQRTTLDEVAELLNGFGEIRGMGSGWTARRVKRVVDPHVPAGMHWYRRRLWRTKGTQGW